MGNFFTKASRRIANIGYAYIRWNSHYKPNGVFPTTEQYRTQVPGNDLTCQVIYPDLATTLKIPYLLYNALSGYSKYDDTVYIDSDPALTARTTYKLVQAPHGRLYSNNMDMVAVITADNKLLGDVSYQYHPDRPAQPLENRVLRQRYFITPRRYKGTGCNLLAGGGAVDNYTYWLLDVLPRLHLLGQAGQLQKTDWFVVPGYRHEFQKKTLELLGIDESKVLPAKDQVHAQFDLLLSTTSPRGNRSKIVPQWVVNFLRDSFLAGNSHSHDSPFVYLTAEPSAVRVQNEPELKAMLGRYGFSFYTMNELGFEEKVRIFSSAKVIVAACQIHLTNLVFCQKGAKVVEMVHSEQVDTFHYNLASFAGADYHYVPCKAHRHVLNPNPSADGAVVVETHKIRLLLDKFTGRQARLEEAAEQAMPENQRNNAIPKAS